MNSQQKINFHTHCTFCDGKNSPEEMILSAINKNFTVLGFSSHSTYPLSSDFYSTIESRWHIADGNFEAYVKTIRDLANKYADKIKIVLGFEADFLSSKYGNTCPDFEAYSALKPDYLIGSVHFVANDKGFYSVDNKTDVVAESLKKMYTDKNGTLDAKAVVHDYFEAERQMLKTCNFSILGHPDLIRLRNQDLHYFDENDEWYKDELKATVKAAATAGVSVEINTGAIGRKLMNDSYPSDYFLSLLHDAGVPVCINSDSHAVDTLDTAFDHAVLKAKKAGYTELVYPTQAGSFTVKL